MAFRLFFKKIFQSTRTDQIVLQKFNKNLQSWNVLGPARHIRTFNVMSEVNCVLLGRRLRFEILRYIQIFEVISKVFCLLLRRMRRFENNVLYPNFWRYIRKKITFYDGGGRGSNLIRFDVSFPCKIEKSTLYLTFWRYSRSDWSFWWEKKTSFFNPKGSLPLFFFGTVKLRI